MEGQNKLTRSFKIDRSGINIEERTVELSFSSENIAPRKNGGEIISHRTGDYDFTLLNDNGPLLIEHNVNRQIGKIVSASVSDGRGIATVMFSRTGEGAEVFQDVIDGIRSHVSVGYFAKNPTLEKQTDTGPVYRYQWKPYEISMVSALPVDRSVGIGRSESDVEIQTPNIEPQINEDVIINEKRNIQMELENSKVEEVISSIETQTRSHEAVEQITRGAKPADVEAICRHFGYESDASELVARSATIEEVKAHVEAKFRAASQATRSIAAPAVHIKQERSFDTAKAFAAATVGNWDKAGFEREVCQERAHQDGRTWQSNTVLLDPNAKVRAANTVGTATGGAELVGTNYMHERLIDALWNKCFIKSLGADEMLGLQGNASFPVISSNAVSVFQGETAALPTAQALTTGLKTISPKQLVSKFGYSKQLLVQGLPNIESKILDQLYKSIAQKLDQVAISNSGTTLSTTGLLNDVTQVVALGATGAAPSLKTFYDLRTKLVNSKALEGNLGFAISGSLNEKLFTTLKDSANTASGYILNEGQTTIAGLPYVWSQNVPNDLSKSTGTNLSAAILGNWDDFLVAQWGSILVELDPYTAADNGQVIIRSFSWWDMLIKRLESFAVCKDIVTA